MSSSPSHFSLRQRLRYRFDNTLARGAAGLILWLAAITLSFVLLAAVVLAILGVKDNDGREFGFLEGFWQALLRTLDPGTMGGDQGWGYRLMSLSVTVIGIFIVATLIGLITTALDAKLQTLQRGRAPIAERGHTLVLGWSPKVFTIVSELSVANENQPRSCVVVLADQDMQMMDEELRDRSRLHRNTRVVCRSGSPTERADLAIVNPHLARSIIVLDDGEAGEDAHVIKTVLALLSFDPPIPDIPIVAEVGEPSNADALRSATRGRVTVLQTAPLIARTAAQACRQPGMNVIYQELLDFAGDEVYFAAVPELVGLTYGDALNAFEDSALIGMRTAAGACLLNPPMDRPFADGDHVIAVTEDDDTIRFSGLQSVDPPVAAEPHPPADPPAERTVVLGWNDIGALMIGELDQYVPPGSRVTVVADPALAPDPAAELEGRLSNLEVDVLPAPGTGHAAVARVLGGDDYDHVLILCYRQGLPQAEADARALLTLLQVRQALERAGRPVNVVTEVLDERAVDLAPKGAADEFIVSERLTSLAMAQLSENAELEGVFDDLFDAEGCELYCKPVERYATPGQAVTFAQLVEAARRRGETAVGYRDSSAADDMASAFGVMINPTKSIAITPRAGDLVVVICEDER